MADEDVSTQPDGAQDGDGGTAQEANDARPGGGGDGGSDDTLSAEDARKLRSEASALRKRLRDTETKLTKREQADLTEQQKAQVELEQRGERISKLESGNRSLRVQLAAAKVGVRTEATQAAAALLDWNSIEDPDDDKQIERALKELVKQHSYLSAVSRGVDGGAGRSERAGTNDMNSLLRQAVGIR